MALICGLGHSLMIISDNLPFLQILACKNGDFYGGAKISFPEKCLII